MAHETRIENRVDVPTMGAPAQRRAVALDETSANAGHADDVRATLSSSPQRGAAKRRVSTARIAAATVLIFFLGVGRAAAATGRSGDSSAWLSWLRDLVPSGVGGGSSRRQAADDAASQDQTDNVTELVVPYISGVWQFTYEYNEMVGLRDNLQKNPCYGPFPYRYTWNVYIWQKVNNINGTRKTSGDMRVCMYDWMDCPTQSRAWTLVESERDILNSKCRFAPYDEYPNDWFRYPGYMQGGYQKEIVPTDKNGRPVPVRLFDAFKTPNVGPWVWGVFCEQFSWFDGKTDVKNTPQPLYEGTWRHENESWVILREVSTCPCFPMCIECEESIPGTQFKQVLESDGGECLARYKTKATQCQYVIRGVSGGVIRYPTVTTGVEIAEDGENDQVCFAYANIKGVKLKDAKMLPSIREASWDGMGVPSDNVDPTL